MGEAPMTRWAAMAALLRAMGAAVPGWAGDAEDCRNVASLIKTDPTRVVVACRRLADRGDAVGQYGLGHAYFSGQGVPQDYAEAMKWYRKAADQGDAPAQYNLGVGYQ